MYDRNSPVLDEPIQQIMENSTSLYNTNFSAQRDKVKVVKLIVLCIYGCLSVGILFNCSVVATILNVFRNLKRHCSTNKHTFIYILALSCVDALVLSNLPFIVVDTLNGWIFGTVLCKIHAVVDSVNKVLSTFILTALSFDRYLVVCYPHKFSFWRTTKATLAVLAVCITAASLLLSPVYVYRDVESITIQERNITIVKCMLNWENEMQGRDYMYSIFCLGFCIPLILMTFFYSNIVVHMWQSYQRTGRQRRNYTRKVTKRISILVIFYFFCWTPYYTVQFYSFYINSLRIEQRWVPKLMYMVQVLTYLNSAVNPLLYALLNRELRRQCFMNKNKNGQVCEAIEIRNNSEM